MTTHQIAHVMLDNPERELFVAEWSDEYGYTYEPCTGVDFGLDTVALFYGEQEHHIQTEAEYVKEIAHTLRPSLLRQLVYITNIR